jgi:hypothetical protein
MDGQTERVCFSMCVNLMGKKTERGIILKGKPIRFRFVLFFCLLPTFNFRWRPLLRIIIVRVAH